jgi:hypothetical protein
MSREYEQTEQTHIVTRCTKLTCDVCGREGAGDSWEAGLFEANDTTMEVTVHHKDGMVDRDGGGAGDEYTIDICPECFKDKLIPWVESFGHAKIAAKYYEH